MENKIVLARRDYKTYGYYDSVFTQNGNTMEVEEPSNSDWIGI